MNSRDILFDASRLIWRAWSGRHPTGIDRVCLAYIEYYAPRSLAVVQRNNLRIVLSARHSDHLFKILTKRGPGTRSKIASLLAAAAISGSRKSIKGFYYFNVGHTGLEYSELNEWITNNQLRPIFFIHDLIPITHPEYCRPGESTKHKRRIQTVLNNAVGIVANSAATRNAIENYAASIGIAVSSVKVAWLAPETIQPSSAALNAPWPYFVSVGTIEARKNHMLLLRVWERLVNKFGSSAPRLILIGQRGWEAQEVFNLLDNAEHLKNHVHELGRCDDGTMAEWINGARAVLMPSFAEGFGIPVLEALMRSVPVIASDLSVFREIAGSIPRYLDPFDTNAWLETVIDYCDDCPDRVRQIKAIANFAAPSWPEHFTEVDKWLSTIGL